MKCKKVQESLYDFLSQRLDKRIFKEIRKHIDICMKCRAELEDLKKTAFLLDQWKVPDVPEGFKERIRKRVEEDAPAPLPHTDTFKWTNKIFYPYYKIPLEIAASLLIIILGLYIYRVIIPRPVSDYNSIFNRYELPRGEGLIDLKKAEKPILIEVNDIEASMEHLNNILETHNGKLIPPEIFLEKGYLLTISAEKGKEEALLEALSQLGKRTMEKEGYKDKRGNINIAILQRQKI